MSTTTPKRPRTPVKLSWRHTSKTISLDAPIWWAACFGQSSKELGKWYWKVNGPEPANGIATTWKEAVAEIKWRVLADSLYEYTLPDETNHATSLAHCLASAKKWEKWEI